MTVSSETKPFGGKIKTLLKHFVFLLGRVCTEASYMRNTVFKMFTHGKYQPTNTNILKNDVTVTK